MGSFLQVAIVAAAAAASEPELCLDNVHEIPKDVRIVESDLTRESALNAINNLRQLVETGEVGDESEMRAQNQSKIVYGYLLRLSAQQEAGAAELHTDRKHEAKNAFCNWLNVEGFWYD